MCTIGPTPVFTVVPRNSTNAERWRVCAKVSMGNFSAATTHHFCFTCASPLVSVESRFGMFVPGGFTHKYEDPTVLIFLPAAIRRKRWIVNYHPSCCTGMRSVLDSNQNRLGKFSELSQSEDAVRGGMWGRFRWMVTQTFSSSLPSHFAEVSQFTLGSRQWSCSCFISGVLFSLGKTLGIYKYIIYTWCIYYVYILYTWCFVYISPLPPQICVIIKRRSVAEHRAGRRTAVWAVCAMSPLCTG